MNGRRTGCCLFPPPALFGFLLTKAPSLCVWGGLGARCGEGGRGVGTGGRGVGSGGAVAQEVRAVVWQSEDCRFDPTLGVSKCP